MKHLQYHRSRKPVQAFIAALVILLFCSAWKPAPKPRNFTVAFYNVENLFDLVHEPGKFDEEFTPEGANAWTADKYEIKMKNLSRVISQLGDDDGPEILGLCEVENRKVLEDLIATETLEKHGYGIVHYESPDARGIDCALLYKKNIFLPLYSRTFTVDFKDTANTTTRDILLVKGLIYEREEVTFIVNHWSSRRGGAEASNWKRMTCASTIRHALDSIQELNPYANLVLMGDFNDNPGDDALRKGLLAGRDTIESEHTLLYNPMHALKQCGLGTHRYKDEWNLFDQIIVSHNMLQRDNKLRYVYGSADVYKPEWMQVAEGYWKGAPRRSYVRHKFYEDGFSDHFPVYAEFEWRKK